jgi:hypothetical protein
VLGLIAWTLLDGGQRDSVTFVYDNYAHNTVRYSLNAHSSHKVCITEAILSVQQYTCLTDCQWCIHVVADNHQELRTNCGSRYEKTNSASLVDIVDVLVGAVMSEVPFLTYR